MHLAHLNETSEAFRNMSSENELKPPSKCYSMRQFMEAQWIDSMSILFDGICYKDHPLTLIFFSGPLHWSLLKQEKYCTKKKKKIIYSSKFSRPRESICGIFSTQSADVLLSLPCLSVSLPVLEAISLLSKSAKLSAEETSGVLHALLAKANASRSVEALA